MSTARDIITGALREIGALAIGETASAEQAADGLNSINDMLDSWSLENLIIHAKVREEFTLVASDSSYTMGVSGQFNTVRPLSIENAGIKDGTTEFPILIINKDQYAAIPNKTLTSTFPTHIYPEGTSTLETINVYPVPSAAITLVLYSWKPLTRFSNLSTTVDLPPGYNRALTKNLAIELAPSYGKAVVGELMVAATESKANVKRLNSKPIYMTTDCPVGRGYGYNIYTGGYN